MEKTTVPLAEFQTELSWMKKSRFSKKTIEIKVFDLKYNGYSIAQFNSKTKLLGYPNNLYLNQILF